MVPADSDGDHGKQKMEPHDNNYTIVHIHRKNFKKSDRKTTLRQS